MGNSAYIRGYLNDARTIIDKLNVEDISYAIDVLYRAWEGGKKVFICGNGGSASTATHFAADLNKCTICEGSKKRFRVISMVDNIPWCSALTNDEGWDKLYEEQLRNFFEPGDVVVALSVHGGSGKDKAGAWSQNLLKALQYAKDNGGKAVGFSGFSGGAMKELADVCVVVPFNSTPQVESFHVVLHHLIAFGLKEKIAKK